MKTHPLYPVAAFGGLAAWSLAYALAWSLETMVLGWTLAMLAWGVWLERRQPLETDWLRARPGEACTDRCSALVLLGAVDPLLKAALPLAVLALWPSGDALQAPLVLQALLALLWMELAKYASHRLHHEWGPLWRLHALHHSSERLYWLNNFRFHPLNYALNQTLALLPLLMLGVAPEALSLALAFSQPVLVLQHLNADVRSGFWNRVFSTHEAHRWHHSARPEEANANYGAALLIWDQLFGTYRWPVPGERPARIGLFGNGGGYPARASYLKQLLGGCCA
ncbi:MAG: sterol desaturase family protein [Inhella sp.]